MLFGGVFSELRDIRRAQGKRYALEPLLCAMIKAFLSKIDGSGHDDWTSDILGQWVAGAHMGDGESSKLHASCLAKLEEAIHFLRNIELITRHDRASDMMPQKAMKRFDRPDDTCSA